MIRSKNIYQFLHKSTRATRLAYLYLARKMLSKKWEELRGSTLMYIYIRLKFKSPRSPSNSQGMFDILVP
jgi:hypothetical protein